MPHEIRHKNPLELLLLPIQMMAELLDPSIAEERRKTALQDEFDIQCAPFGEDILIEIFIDSCVVTDTDLPETYIHRKVDGSTDFCGVVAQYSDLEVMQREHPLWVQRIKDNPLMSLQDIDIYNMLAMNKEEEEGIDNG